MRYYLVWVRSQRYRGHEPLTYAFDGELQPGAIVQVSLQRERVLGWIDRAVERPSFDTKPIDNVLPIPPLPVANRQLAVWIQQFYATGVGVAAQQLLPAILPRITMAATKPFSAPIITPDIPQLTEVQADVVKKISVGETNLLHGITGSGKTRMYIDVAMSTVSAKRSAIILTPEISLTSQLAQSFKRAFGERVVILHSQLTAAERQRIWLTILLSTEPLVIVGPRSALFSPVHDLGLIVIDESHEPAYKQEQSPYYHATRVASQLAHLHNATLILGSATPSVGDYYMAEQRNKPILRINARATASDYADSEVTLVDLKDRAQFTRSNQLSTPLVQAVQAALGRGEQALIYLNRRGTARIVLCENCGWQAACPHCDLPLVYHADSGDFRCHTCGYHEPLRPSCPDCGHPSVVFKSFGTKAVYDEVHKLFPEARVMRFDTDNSKAERFEQHYEAVKRGEIDILVGTQLLAKGLDLPKLSTLGVLLADSSLFLPDFSASERTYQLLTQVLGRVGRGHVAGHAIIQTYQPESPLLATAISGDWDGFYTRELAERRKFHFPPFYHLLKLSCRRASVKSAEKAASDLAAKLSDNITHIEIDGPVPSFHEKLQGKYQYQLVVKTTQRARLIDVIKQLPSGWTYDIDPINLL